jgi:hypothetical protein
MFGPQRGYSSTVNPSYLTMRSHRANGKTSDLRLPIPSALSLLGRPTTGRESGRAADK